MRSITEYSADLKIGRVSQPYKHFGNFKFFNKFFFSLKSTMKLHTHTRVKHYLFMGYWKHTPYSFPYLCAFIMQSYEKESWKWVLDGLEGSRTSKNIPKSNWTWRKTCGKFCKNPLGRFWNLLEWIQFFPSVWAPLCCFVGFSSGLQNKSTLYSFFIFFRC